MKQDCSIGNELHCDQQFNYVIKLRAKGPFHMSQIDFIVSTDCLSYLSGIWWNYEVTQ